MRKHNIKTLQRLFSVLGVLVTVLILFSVMTPLTFASVPVDNNVYDLPIDNSFQYLYKYFFGANSGIVDFKENNSSWYRVIIDNNTTKVTVDKQTIDGRTLYYLNFTDYSDNALTTPIYYTVIGSSYSSNTRFSSSSWVEVKKGSFMAFSCGSVLYVNSCASPISINSSVSTSNLSHCDFNAYYPFSATSSGSGVTVDLSSVLNNQSTIILKESEILSQMSQNQMDNWRYFTALSREFKTYSSVNQSMAQSIANSQEVNANSRQSEIMQVGSDVTVSTIDNWIGGNDGLAAKLTQLAATLSSNAAVFSENQVSNQENLSKAGAFVHGVFNQFPVAVVAALICFLIMLIAVKVVGR